MKTYKVPKTSSQGYAIAPIYLVKQAELVADTRTIAADEIDAEIARFDAAVEKAQAELLKLAGTDEIFAGHYALAGDITLYDGVTGRIRDQLQNAEAALMDTADEYAGIFASMEDAYLRERAADMQDVSRRLLCALKGLRDNPFREMREKSIIVAKDMAPSDIAKMNPDLAAGLITEEGGVTSHVSIIARSRGIPCLVGAGPVMEQMEDGQMAIMDAAAGSFYLDPDETMIAEYQKKAEEYRENAEEMERISTLPSETKDGHRFQICANVSSSEDVKNAIRYSIEGVGLFRTEFLYMESDHFPTEEEQFAAYREAAGLLEGRVLTIRTLDIGGDKGLNYYDFPKEDNPFLGYRAIRFCLDQPEIFRTQLRAILRASAFGHVRILYPMMISLDELHQANALLEECKKELLAEKIKFDENIQTGIMVETPAAVLMADEFAQEVDFFSIGSNDLTQYITAADRGSRKISALCDPFNPAVLRAIGHTIEAAHRHNAKAGMCGEFAQDEKAAGILLGLGLDEFSVSPGSAARIKYVLRDCSFEEMKARAEKVLKLSTVEDVRKII